MKGSVYKRCPCGVTGGGPARPAACKKAHGAWYYVADVDPDRAGRRRQERKGGFRTAEQAHAALAAVLTGIATGTHAHDEGKTVAVYLDEWLRQRIAGGLRVTTARSYRQHIDDYLTPALGRYRLRDLRPGHVNTWLTRFAAQPDAPGPSTRRRVHATLRSALSSALRLQLVAVNAAANVDLPAASRPKVRPWEAEELGAFLDFVAADPLGPLYELVAATGMRRGEAAALRWEALDLDAASLTVRLQLVQINLPADRHPLCPFCASVHRGLMFGPVKTRSGEERRVDLDSHTVGALLAHRLRQDADAAQWGEAYVDHGLVFAREDGNPLALDAVTKRFRALEVAAGLRPVRLHDLRHGAASLRLATGTDIAIVSKTLGHSSIAITSDTYSHLLAGVGRKAAEAAMAIVPRNQRDHAVTSTAETAADDDRLTAVVPAGEGAPPGTRTPNPRIKSPLLCQLS
jgi:integrase